MIMYQRKTVFLWLLVYLTLPLVHSSNILFLMAFGSKSHKQVLSPLAAALAQRGHNVTFVSPYKNPEKIPNLHEIVPVNLDGKFDNLPVGFDNQFGPLMIGKMISQFGAEVVDSIFSDPSIQDIMKLKQKYDLVVMHAFFNDFLAAIPYQLNVPFIMISPAEALSWSYMLLGMNPPLDQEPTPFVDFGNHMSFYQRTINTLLGINLIAAWKYFFVAQYDEHIAHWYPNLPSVADIEMNTSLLFTNTHHSVNHVHPSPLELIEVGAMHCRPPKPLPPVLEEFVAGSGEHGVILLSFGSVLRGSNLPEKARQVFVSVFSRLPQRIIWKWEDDQGIANLSSNVLLYPWLPQQDLLGHPKVRLFITHGGLLSTQESVYHACPLIGLPVFGDQHMNMKKAERDGYAISHSWQDLTEDQLLQSIEQLLTNDSYKVNVQRLSKMLRDQPETPLERAVYWTEYVIRHGGAAHLRSSGRSLSFFQRALLDVMLFILVCLVTSVTVIALGCYFSFRFLRSRWNAKKITNKKTESKTRSKSKTKKKIL